MSRTTVAVVSDLHCGSVHGLMPPNFRDRGGALIGQNKGQAYLWECWQDYCQNAWKHPVAAVVIDGDAVDGKQRKNGCVGVLADMAEQSRAARDVVLYLLSGFSVRPRLYMVKGTPYHAGEDARDEEGLAEALGAEEYSGAGSGFYVRDVLDLRIGSTLINFSHHLPYAPVNRTMPIYREIQRALVAEFKGAPRADILVRAHVHYHAIVGTGREWAFTLPCWQLPTSYQYKGTAFPDVSIGGALIHIDRENKAENRIECQPYGLPMIQREVVEI